MDTIESVVKKPKSSQPYTKPLKAQVVATTKLDGKYHIVLADHTSFIKLISTRQDLERKFKGSITIRDFNKGYTCLFTTKDTKVAPATSVHVPPEILQAAVSLATDQPPEVVQMKDITEPTTDKLLTVEGVVIKVTLSLDTLFYNIIDSLTYFVTGSLTLRKPRT